ncbi:MAG: tripartite tricarboxylate transporter TctB family protein [Alphaproteobacteria bacterium]|nr:tripartite tricarboxylate transporter TctB family protein [Alphaproteobacteria bacterium]
MTLSLQKALVYTIAAIGIALLLLFWQTGTFSESVLPGYPGDAFFPRLILIFSLIWVAVLLLRLFRRAADTEPTTGLPKTVAVELIPFAVVAGCVLAYIFLLPILGFELCTFLFLFGLLFTRWRDPIRQRVIRVAALSLSTTLFFYVVFILLLNVSFPVRILPRYIQF